MLIVNKHKIENKKINLGIEILRMILCFWVLSFHCLEENKINYFIFFITKTKFYHVPCFSLISFFFSYNIFSERNINKFKNRLERLLIPYIIWPLLIFVIHNILNRNNPISLNQLKIQLIFGRQFNVPLWYLFGTILLSIIFFILSIIMKNNFLLAIKMIAIISYFIQYSGYYKYFDEYQNDVRLPILDTLSILPLSIVGLLFASSNYIEILKKKNSLFFSYLFIFILFKFDIFIDLGGYNGIINIFASLFFFVGFYLLPLDNANIFIKRIIKQITNYTNGIYCLQSTMIPFVRTKFYLEGKLKTSFTIILNAIYIIIYLFSYFVSFIGTKIFGKNKLKYLFI